MKIIIFDLFATLLDKVWFDYDKGLSYLADNYFDHRRDELKLYAEEYRERFMLDRNKTQCEKSFFDQLVFYENKFGKKQLELKLTAVKGVDRKLVSEILDEQLSDDEELLKATAFSKKYISQKKLDSSKESKAKLANWLYSKGFEWDIINRAITAADDDFISPDEEV